MYLTLVQPCPLLDRDGGYGSWGSWASCSVTCGIGTKIRTRACDNPTMEGSGLACSGDSDDSTTCIQPACEGKLTNSTNEYMNQ